MTSVMKGVKVVEVAEQAFGPGAAALLSAWGADVIKIEPVERGDASRGLNAQGRGFPMLFHYANRGKRSIALDLASPEGLEILYKLIEEADVFLINKLPKSRRKLKIDVDDLKARNPRLIYVRATGQGVNGPEADRGAYDLLTYWHRAGASSAVRSPRDEIPFLPAPGFGDFTGAMYIAGGIMGALYHRERTGHAPVVDASLLATGLWSMGVSISTAATEGDFVWPPAMRNPLSAIYKTKDDRYIALSCLQAGVYWKPLCEVLEEPELAADPRFADYPSIMAHFRDAEDALIKAFAKRPIAEWRERLETFSGQWAVVQSATEVAVDPQIAPNGYILETQSSDGQPFKVVSPPIQYDGAPPELKRGPDFNEHGDEILAGIGMDAEAIIDLKVRGVVG